MTSDFLEFARLELLKERFSGICMKHQADAMNMQYYTMVSIMNGHYKNNPVTKLINYLIEKGGVKLCPRQKEELSKF